MTSSNSKGHVACSHNAEDYCIYLNIVYTLNINQIIITSSNSKGHVHTTILSHDSHIDVCNSHK